MNPRKGILRFWGVFLALLALALGVITLIHRWHRVFPSSEVSEVYAHYENVEGIDASFVKKYRINDSVFVDVTMLQATDSAGWKMIKEEFNIFDADDLPPEEREIFNTYFNQSIVLKKVVPGKYNQQSDTNVNNNDVIAYERAKKRVCIFHTAHSTGQRGTSNYIFNQMISNNTLNIKDYEEKH